MENNMNQNEQEIRKRAHEMWKREGRQMGNTSITGKEPAVISRDHLMRPTQVRRMRRRPLLWLQLCRPAAPFQAAGRRAAVQTACLRPQANEAGKFEELSDWKGKMRLPSQISFAAVGFMARLKEHP
jgi:hypothetical protein